jgi:hypothetical protein
MKKVHALAGLAATAPAVAVAMAMAMAMATLVPATAHAATVSRPASHEAARTGKSVSPASGRAR